MNLSSWFKKNFWKALVIILLGVLLPQLIFLAYINYSESKEQDKIIHRYVEVVTLAVQQSNRTLLESSLLMGTHELGATEILVCKNLKLVAAFPSRVEDSCIFHSPPSLFERTQTKNLIGSDSYILDIKFKRFSNSSIFFSVAMGTFLLFIVVLVGLFQFQKRLKTDIIHPLLSGINGPLPLQISELEEIRINNKQQQEKEKETAVKEAIYAQSIQIAHDIRAPILAIETLLSENFGHKKQDSIQEYLNRAKGIADDLLAKNKISDRKEVINLYKRKVEELTPLIKRIITEKEDTFHKKIAFTSTEKEYYSYIDATIFLRILSNIISNAFEALDNTGEISLSLSSKENKIFLSIKDTGKGIPEEILTRLGSKGETFNKEHGSGLGLYYAKTTLLHWEGNLQIESKLGLETTVTIILPQVKNTDFFSNIYLENDPLFRRTWEKSAMKANVSLIAVSSIQEFLEKENQISKEYSTIYLDSDLGENSLSGEEFAVELKAKGYKNIFLATLYSEEKFRHLPWLKVVRKEAPWK